MKKTAIAIAAAFVAGGLLGGLVYAAVGLAQRDGRAAASRPAWSETSWPFPIDQWGRGKAYRCTAADCGAEVSLYIRAKIGFCNCATGVADDEELERVSDRELLGANTRAREPGHAIAVAWMKGRSRVYDSLGNFPAGTAALAIAYNDRCDVIVATAVVAHGKPQALEPMVLKFLNSEPVMRWAERTLGL